MNITEFRKTYPQYDSLSDDELATRIYGKYYKDKLDEATFRQRFGVATAETVAPEARERVAPTDTSTVATPTKAETFPRIDWTRRELKDPKEMDPGKPQAEWGEVTKNIPTATLGGFVAGAGGAVQVVADTMTPQPPKEIEFGESMLEKISGALDLVQQQAMKLGVAGAAQAYRDRVGDIPEIREAVDQLRGVGEGVGAKGKKLIEGATPENMSFWQQAVFNAGISLGHTGAMAIPAAVAKNPNLLIYGLGTLTAMQSYDEGKAAGLDAPSALRYATLDGLIEAGSEYLPIKTLFAKHPNLISKIASFMVREIPGENVAEVSQKVNAFLHGLDDDISLKALVDTMKLTTASTLISGGAQSSVAHGMQKTGEMVEGLREKGQEIITSVYEGRQERKLDALRRRQTQIESDLARMAAEGSQVPVDPNLPFTPTARESSQATTTANWGQSIFIKRKAVPVYRTQKDKEGISLGDAPIAPGEVVMVAEPDTGLNTEVQDIGRETAKAAEKWIKAFDPEMKLIFSPDGHVGKVLGARAPELGIPRLNQAYGHQYALQDKTVVIEMDPAAGRGKNGKIDRASWLLTFSHEFGHGLVATKFHQAAQFIQEALMGDYNRFINSLKGMSYQQFVAEVEGGIPGVRHYNAKGSPTDINIAEFLTTKRNILYRQLKEEVARQGSRLTDEQLKAIADKSASYLINFDEFMAHQMAKFVQTNTYPQTALGKWFKDVVNVMRRFYRMYKGSLRNPTAAPSFTKWMELLATQAEIQKIQKEQDWSQAFTEERAELPASKQAQTEALEVNRQMAEGVQESGGEKEGKKTTKYKKLTATTISSLETARPACPTCRKRSTVEFNGVSEEAINYYCKNCQLPIRIQLPRGQTLLANQAMQLGFDANTINAINVHRDLSLKWPAILKVLTPIQIAERYDVEQAKTYMAHVAEFARTKMQTIFEADQVAQDWWKQIKYNGKKGKRISNFLFDVTLESEAKGRKLSVQEAAQLAKEKGLRKEDFELYLKIDKSLADVLGKLEYSMMVDAAQAVGIENAEALVEMWQTSTVEERIQLIAKIVGQDPAIAALHPLWTALSGIEQNMGKYKNRNYFPLSRFGSYTLTLRANETVTFEQEEFAEGSLVAFETFETAAERDQALQRYRKSFRGALKYKADKLDDTVMSLSGMPQVVIEKVRNTMDLSEQQQEQLQDIALAMAPGRGFMKHMRKRAGVRGFHKEALRNYASYMLSAANHMARIQHGSRMARVLSDFGAELTKVQDGDVTGMREIQQYFQRHYEYIMNPGNEWTQLRALGFLWYLGFNVKSAVINLTQVPMVTYPVMAGMFGDSAAIAEITKAYKDVRMDYHRGGKLAPEVRNAIEQAVRENVINESMAMELAGLGEGQTMGLFSETGRYIDKVSYYGGFLFQTAEKYNRMVSFVAAFRAARKQGQDEGQAYLAAKTVVQKSQYEYAGWNRPEIARGKKSVIFLFKQHLQHTAYLMFNGQRNAEGRATAVRMWITMTALAGAGGWPLMENIFDLIDFTGGWLKKMLNVPDPRMAVRDDIRKFISELNGNPDLIMHGLSREYGLGPMHLLELINIPVPHVDVSGSLSLGEVVPGTGGLTKEERNPDALLGKMVVDLAGPVGGIPYSIWRAVESDDPNEWKRWERALPVALKNGSKAARRLGQGGEHIRGGATVDETPTGPLGAAEAVIQGLGFALTRLNQKSERAMAYRNAATFYLTRRQLQLETYSFEVMHGSEEGREKSLKAIAEYNDMLRENDALRPLMISSKTLKQSVRMRIRKAQLESMGVAGQKGQVLLRREFEELYPVIGEMEEELSPGQLE